MSVDYIKLIVRVHEISQKTLGFVFFFHGKRNLFKSLTAQLSLRFMHRYFKLKKFKEKAVLFLSLFFSLFSFKIMEVLRSEFLEKLPVIKKAILEADFISIDTEFTGN